MLICNSNYKFFFFIQGSNTSSITISTTLLMLAIHTEWQEKVIKELDEIIGNTDRDITINDTLKMENLDLVIKEVLRISGVPHAGRELEQDTQVGKLFYIYILRVFLKKSIFII